MTERAIAITIGLRTLVFGALFVALVVAVASIKEFKDTDACEVSSSDRNRDASTIQLKKEEV